MEWGRREWLALAKESLFRGFLFTIFLSLLGMRGFTNFLLEWFLLSLLIFVYVPLHVYCGRKIDETIKRNKSGFFLWLRVVSLSSVQSLYSKSFSQAYSFSRNFWM